MERSKRNYELADNLAVIEALQRQPEGVARIIVLLDATGLTPKRVGSALRRLIKAKVVQWEPGPDHSLYRLIKHRS